MDFIFMNHGSVCQLTPITQAAKDWVAENVQTEGWMGRSVAIEPRYVQPILDGIEEAGMSCDA